MPFKSDRQRKAVMAKYRYRIYISNPETGMNKPIPTTETFKTKKSATTFANIETIAGMGENYSVKRYTVNKQRRKQP